MSTAKNYLSLPINEFLADTAARTPTPGGGSVAALTGALGAALACMVVEFTLGKKQFEDHSNRLQQLLDEYKRMREEFGQLVTEDIAAYEAVSAARRQREDEEAEAALARAVAVPMQIVSLAAALAIGLDEMKTFVNPNLIGDLRVAATLAEASARAAGSTVRTNLDVMPDRREAARLEDRLDLLLGRTERHRNAVVHFHSV